MLPSIESKWPLRRRSRPQGSGPAAQRVDAPPVSLRRLRKRGQDLLRGVAVPDPFDLEAFCQRLAQTRGRPLRIIPLPAAASAGACGAWAATATTDYLFFDPATAPLHREHILLHEVGHLLAGHGSVPVATPTPLAAQVCPPAVASLLEGGWLPDLSPETVQHVLARTDYSMPQEQEAEIIATLILERGSRRPAGPASAPGSPAPAAQVLGRLSRALGARPPQA